jgi:hypothetical protein
VEVLGGGLGVAEMEADAHPFPQVLADGHGPTLRVDAHEVPDQEIPCFGLLLELVHDNADKERGLSEAAVTLVEPREELLQGR